jgi:hypothetical protein
MKLYMFGTVPLSIIRSLFTVHSAMVYVIQVCRQLSSRTRMELEFHPFEQDQDGNAVQSWSCSKAVYKPVRHIPLLIVQWINSWWWTEELFETRTVSCQNIFVKLVHLLGFITKKFVKMHGHMNVKKYQQVTNDFSKVCQRPLKLLTPKRLHTQFHTALQWTGSSVFSFPLVKRVQYISAVLMREQEISVFSSRVKWSRFSFPYLNRSCSSVCELCVLDLTGGESVIKINRVSSLFSVINIPPHG